MGRKSNHLMERVYAHLSKNGCRKSGFLADPDLTGTVFWFFLIRGWYECSAGSIIVTGGKVTGSPDVYHKPARQMSGLMVLKIFKHFPDI
jgi:hypothetical protein